MTLVYRFAQSSMSIVTRSQ